MHQLVRRVENVAKVSEVGEITVGAAVVWVVLGALVGVGCTRDKVIGPNVIKRVNK